MHRLRMVISFICLCQTMNMGPAPFTRSSSPSAFHRPLIPVCRRKVSPCLVAHPNFQSEDSEPWLWPLQLATPPLSWIWYVQREVPYSRQRIGMFSPELRQASLYDSPVSFQCSWFQYVDATFPVLLCVSGCSAASTLTQISLALIRISSAPLVCPRFQCINARFCMFLRASVRFGLEHLESSLLYLNLELLHFSISFNLIYQNWWMDTRRIHGHPQKIVLNIPEIMLETHLTRFRLSLLISLLIPGQRLGTWVRLML